jgi:CO/xanthine dehydrogenase Mo-binding subunit
MATLVLGAVGSAIGGAFGGAILGFSGAAIGGFIGSTIGSVVDSWIVSSLAPAQKIDGQRLDSLRIAGTIDVGDRDAGALPHAVLDGAPSAGSWDVDLRLDVPMAAHGPIEPRAAVAEWQDGALRVWSGTQDAFYVHDFLADAFGLSGENVSVQSCRIGGAFGGKTICTVEAEAAALARAVGRPVKVQWTRAQEYALGFHRPPSSHRIRARVAGGRITDWDHAQVSSHILFTAAVVPAWMQTGTNLFAGDGGVARGMAAPYFLGRARAGYDAIRLPVHTGPWRGLGAGPNALAIESAIDEAALIAGADPVDFRIAHAADPRLAAVLARVREISAWGKSVPRAADAMRFGRGIGCGIYKETSYAAAVADVSVDPRGNVRVTGLWCVHDCGFVINPDQVRAQCEGNLVWSLGLVLSDDLPVEQGRVGSKCCRTSSRKPSPPSSRWCPTSTRCAGC